MPTVILDDGSEYTINTLLGSGDSNAKLSKSDQSGKGYLTFGLSLAPADVSGYQVCASSSPGCRAACLFTSGHGKMKPVKAARIAKTKLFFEQRGTFRIMLESELDKANKKAKKLGKIAAVRLNVVSDVMWEKVFHGIHEQFHDIQFYDYTKHFPRMINYCQKNKKFPKNYHLTFSRSECNHADCLTVLSAGGNVTVVFDSKNMPKDWMGYPLINGDETDLRFLDKPRSVVGLYAKGDGKKDESGFVLSLPVVK